VARVDELLGLFGDVPFAGADDLGRVYEYFLGRFARAEGRRGGQFYTPRSLVLLLRGLLHPFSGTVYDPCCGTGGMFVHGGAVRDAFGQESNPLTWRLARQNLALHGASADLGPRPADTFAEDLHAGRLADRVLANPPFNQADWGSRDRWPHGTPPAANANFAWLQHVLGHLAPGGRAAVVLANGSLGAGKAEGAIRRALVEAGHVERIVALPPQLFLSTPIPACVWVLSREPVERTVLVDARALGTLVDRTRRELSAADIGRIAASDPEISAAADRAAIARNGFVLFPGRYVAPRAPAETEPPRARWRRLVAEWAALAEESERLGREIRGGAP
jgi:type I restriction enzyme M protein